MLKGDNCRVARLDADTGLPLLKEVRNWEAGGRGNLLHRREALEVMLYPRDSDVACRGSIAEDPSDSEATGSRSGSSD